MLRVGSLLPYHACSQRPLTTYERRWLMNTFTVIATLVIIGLMVVDLVIKCKE